MATLTAVPVEEYLRRTYHPDMEYVAGQLVERNVGEYFHGRLQCIIGALLGAREKSRRFRTFTALRVRVSDEPRYRIPDICVKALPHEVTPVLIRPDLAIEVISPDDTIADMLGRIGDYVAAEIPYIWVADPYKKILVEVSQGIIRRPATMVLATDFAALFQELDEPAE
jgi:Uma2 family endonuclease